MRKPMKPETRAKLIQACRDAKNPGKCKYADGDGPGCVVGQFAFTMGTPIEKLKWADDEAESSDIGNIQDNPATQFEEVLEVDTRYLWELQDIWDDTPEHMVDAARARMIAYVEAIP